MTPRKRQIKSNPGEHIGNLTHFRNPITGVDEPINPHAAKINELIWHTEQERMRKRWEAAQQQKTPKSKKIAQVLDNNEEEEELEYIKSERRTNIPGAQDVEAIASRLNDDSTTKKGGGSEVGLDFEPSDSNATLQSSDGEDLLHDAEEVLDSHEDDVRDGFVVGDKEEMDETPLHVPAAATEKGSKRNIFTDTDDGDEASILDTPRAALFKAIRSAKDKSSRELQRDIAVARGGSKQSGKRKITVTESISVTKKRRSTSTILGTRTAGYQGKCNIKIPVLQSRYIWNKETYSIHRDR
ncbi:hypothetical protein BDV96DRAFT_641702 [Lophiotrema nucula]|uniref:Uncharacterized protein n=1 Tax=Lophiotrema nucula TaxID=690887 RepID=A0A6A5ZLT7_9PLEO|nr:hypothetical protein BDV96DRAFT_641702 [Lophiotrema nucula]